jgi:hypothetical protein
MTDLIEQLSLQENETLQMGLKPGPEGSAWALTFSSPSLLKPCVGPGLVKPGLGLVGLGLEAGP